MAQIAEAGARQIDFFRPAVKTLVRRGIGDSWEGMPSVLIPECLWPIIEKRLPPPAPKPRGGRTRISDRAALSATLFVLRTGIARKYLPPELGWPSFTRTMKSGLYFQVIDLIS